MHVFMHAHSIYILFTVLFDIEKCKIVHYLYIKATILDKTTWENVFINAHYLTQQNYFQINGFA